VAGARRDTPRRSGFQRSAMSKKRPGEPGTASANVACAMKVRAAAGPPVQGSPSERQLPPISALRSAAPPVGGHSAHARGHAARPVQEACMQAPVWQAASAGQQVSGLHLSPQVKAGAGGTQALP
jgi:hypothetical protein